MALPKVVIHIVGGGTPGSYTEVDGVRLSGVHTVAMEHSMKPGDTRIAHVTIGMYSDDVTVVTDETNVTLAVDEVVWRLCGQEVFADVTEQGNSIKHYLPVSPEVITAVVERVMAQLHQDMPTRR